MAKLQTGQNDIRWGGCERAGGCKATDGTGTFSWNKEVLKICERANEKFQWTR
jgi:hypothetical protein